MVVPSRRRAAWLTTTILLLSSIGPQTVLAKDNDPLSIHRRNSQTQPGRSPAEVPLLNHEVPTPKFRHTNDQVEYRRDNEEVELVKYSAIAPASAKGAVRAPSDQSAESQGLLPHNAQQLADWEADDIILLSTIDGALHARDRRSGRHRWTLELQDSPMIQTDHYRQNDSNPGELQPADDYIFIIEPNQDGQLYAQFANPAIGLQKLPATVYEMATKVPFSMQFNGKWFSTTSELTSKQYTIDAETGEVISVFPRPKDSPRIDTQPRCRPRTGLDFEDSNCRARRTIKLGRRSYVFTITNDETQNELCTIRYSEWATNKNDKGLQEAYTTSLDGYDVRTFHDGRVMGFDSSLEDRQHKYHYKLESPVARVFDVARNVEAESDSTDLVVLSRPANFVSFQFNELIQNNLQLDRRVFVNKTDVGEWYVMSEISYPGVTSSASFAKVHSNYLLEPLDLHGDMQDIIGVHVLNEKSSAVGEVLSIGAPPANSNLDIAPVSEHNVEVEHRMTSGDIDPITLWNRVSDAFWGGLITMLVAVVYYCWSQYSDRGKKLLLAEIPATSRPQVVQLSGMDAPTAEVEEIDTSPVREVAVRAVSPLEQNTTPVHSRTQSAVSNLSNSGSSKKNGGDMDKDEGSDAESEDEEPAQEKDTPAPNEEKKRKKTKRGVRGGRRKSGKKAGDVTTFEPKPVLSQEKHLGNGMIQVGRLTYDAQLENCLGQGSSGTAVFPGTFDGRLVAVKRLIKTANSLAEKEIRHLVSSDEHSNVIRYHGKEESISFFYIALDRFDTSLDQFVERPENFPALVSPTRGYDVKDALRQITRGLQHLHSLKLVHRDIKPQNILVRLVKTARPLAEGQLTPLLFVISDFGLCKPLEDGPESVFAATRTAAGTTGWKAPELLVSSRDAIAAPAATSDSIQSQVTTQSTNNSSDGVTAVDLPTGRRATKAIDIFSLGCVFFYVMTRGGHPFDCAKSPLARDLNIKEDLYDTSLLRDSFLGYDYDADDIIMQMIMHDPRMRPDTAGVLAHPYFWKVEHKLEFLCAVSDNYEERKQKIMNIHQEDAPRTDLEKYYLQELSCLQAKAPNVIGVKRDGTLQDWLQALPKSFLAEMGKQRKYTGTKMIDLLRVIRNKKNHFHDLPAEVKEGMMRAAALSTSGEAAKGQIEGYYMFWRDKFPALLVNCHQLVLERGLVESFALERYYK